MDVCLSKTNSVIRIRYATTILLNIENGTNITSLGNKPLGVTEMNSNYILPLNSIIYSNFQHKYFGKNVHICDFMIQEDTEFNVIISPEIRTYMKILS
jgi:hypothetical protein